MLHPVNVETNRANLRDIAGLLNAENIEWAIFFGTLLGITRQSDILPHDDDIDIYVSEQHRGTLIELLNRLEIDVPSEAPNHTPHFLQIKRSQNGEVGFIDFYFYSRDPVREVLIDRWNMLGRPKKGSAALHVPDHLFFPIKKIVFQNKTINIPNDSDGICNLLYGTSWRTPTKKVNYSVMMIKNRPRLIPRLPRGVEKFIPKLLRPYFGLLASKIIGPLTDHV